MGDVYRGDKIGEKNLDIHDELDTMRQDTHAPHATAPIKASTFHLAHKRAALKRQTNLFRNVPSRLHSAIACQHRARALVALVSTAPPRAHD